MRMLQPYELYRAQGFPGWYIIDQDYGGVEYAKDKQVARCGNAVPPPFAEAFVKANLSELCVSDQAAYFTPKMVCYELGAEVGTGRPQGPGNGKDGHQCNCQKRHDYPLSVMPL